MSHTQLYLLMTALTDEIILNEFTDDNCNREYFESHINSMNR